MSTALPFRFTIGQNRQTYVYRPNTISDERVVALPNRELRGVEIGAIFSGDLSGLPSKYGRLLWEVEIDRMPPATIRPIKPKFWLVRNIQLPHGMVQKLVSWP